MKTTMLDKNNYKLFIHRFNQLLSRSGCLKQWSEYTGAKNRYNLLKPITTKCMGLLPTRRTVTNYILPNKITRKWEVSRDNKGIIMNVTGGTFFYIPFNTKVQMCSQYIKFKDTLYNHDKTMGFTTYIVLSGDIKKAASKIRMSEAYEREYYETMMHDD